jgi:hypothetical protein
MIHKCKCGKEYEYPYTLWGCPECITAYNTPEVIKAREEYQKTEAYTHGFHNDSGLIVPNGMIVDITPYGVKYKTREDIKKEINEIIAEIERLEDKRQELEDKLLGR